MEYRSEHDSMGEVLVPMNKYWGAQTQRSLVNFAISDEKIPFEIIHAFGILKKAAALVNLLPARWMPISPCRSGRPAPAPSPT